MNKITRKHYPASKLPKDLRGEISADALVEVQVVEERSANTKLQTLLENIRENPIAVGDTKEAVQRIRVLRDEWDD
ncbi:MAG: hypothetical protein AAF362_02835 [Pseudomonadota bacterium]